MDVIPTRVPPHDPRRPSIHRPAAALLGVIVAFSLGCGYWGRPRMPALAYHGEIQAMSSPLVQHWLRTEYQRTPQLKRAVKEHGLPAYVVMVDRHVVHLIYPEQDKMVSVNTETTWYLALEVESPWKRVVVHDEIPPALLALLPPDRRAEIQARRHEQATRSPSAGAVLK